MGAFQVKAIVFQVAEHFFNGLITNDKFCMVRTGKLRLSHWRLPLKRRIGTAEQKEYSAQQEIVCGGNHETSVDDPPRGEGGSGWAEAMESSLPIDPGNNSLCPRGWEDRGTRGVPCE
jgi:hypothetical protein